MNILTSLGSQCYLINVYHQDSVLPQIVPDVPVLSRFGLLFHFCFVFFFFPFSLLFPFVISNFVTRNVVCVLSYSISQIICVLVHLITSVETDG